MTPAEAARHAFTAVFGQAPQRSFQAPGRVNLIGEHTDYNDGFVFPAAISFGTAVATGPRDDNKVAVCAADYDNKLVVVDLGEAITSVASPMWSNYVRGVIAGLAAAGPVQGANLAVSGNVPQGAGLSSSASLEVAVGTALASLSGLPISPTDIALIGQKSEHDFVGTQCGIMDQLVSATAVAGHASLIDCRSLTTRLVPLPTDLALLIIHSNVKRGLVDSKYNERRASCEEAAKRLGVHALRDVGVAQLDEALRALPKRTGKRARHVITENDRTLRAADAFAVSDMTTLSTLMAASHQSMKHDFEITVPQVDLIVETVDQVIGTSGGVRMTGGGFGGCVVAVLPTEAVSEVTQTLARVYEAATGLKEAVWVSEAAAGAGELFAGGIMGSG